jgi:aspartyl-tRNA(Asn)/glutamyl-tRNA(Gln) amidotransferase subunit A
MGSATCADFVPTEDAVTVARLKAAGAPAPTQVAGRPVSRRGWTAFTYPFNLAGQPAISVPCGWTAEGLPVVLQFVGRRLEDGLVLRAAAFEALAPWAQRRPAVS